LKALAAGVEEPRKLLHFLVSLDIIAATHEPSTII
jgi:hypothetical protein